MTLLDNDHFLTELGKMFQRSRMGGAGSVSITMKRYDGHTKPRARTESTSSGSHNLSGGGGSSGEPKCLLRVKHGSKKISTVINPKDVNKFQLAYANLLKLNMDNLKKRERKAEKESKPKSSRSSNKAQ
uniref:Signal recognition particle 14 kDa protein n=1 Tax=Plectus sambesii TaxID=2011161 RepID=A0A914VJ97_9BILA